MRRPAAATAAVAVLLAGCESRDGDDPAGTPTGTVPTPTGAETTPPTETEETSGPGTTGPSGTESADDAAEDATSEDASEDPTEETSAGATGPTEDTGTAGDGPTGTGSPEALPPWTDDAREKAPDQDAAAVGQEITGVRTGVHEDFDRVVLDLTGDEPVLGWFAGTTDEVVEDPSGRPLDVEGETFLQLGVRGIDWTTESPERYGGAPVSGEGTVVLTEVVFGGLFEGQQQVVLGLREETDYRIFSLSDPARIVVDVRHP